MAQVNDLLVLGKANFLNEITSSQLLRAFGGIALDNSTEQSTALEYVLGIKAFASGGNVMWSSVSNFADVIRLNASGNWSINITGLAARATADASGNTITSTYAKLKSANDMIHAGNEVTWVPSGYKDHLWINYQTCGGKNGNITHYNFGNGKGGTTGVTLVADAFSGNAATANYADSAAKLATPRAIFGHSFDGTADVAGQPLVYGSYNSTAGDRFATGGIQIRENGLVGSSQSDIAYAPAIGFHWGNRIAASLVFHSDGIFYFRKQNFTDRATIDANVNGSLNGNATTASYANKINLNGISNDTKYGTYGGIIQDSSTGPNSGAWHNTIKILHNNSSGYYTSIATQFTGDDGLWFRSYRGGVDQGWKRVAVQNMNNTFSSTNVFSGKTTFNNEVYLNATMTWKAPANISCVKDGSNAECSFDVAAGVQWHIWSSPHGTSMLSCFADNKYVHAHHHLQVGSYNNSSYALTTDSFICNSWIRTTGETGWYNETHGGGWYMTNNKVVRTFNGKPIQANGAGNGGRYIAYPKGGEYSYQGGNITGYLTIYLPTAAFKSSTMLKFKVSIYNYSTSQTVDYIISGYNYNDGQWYNPTAICISPRNNYGNLTVRYGHNGSRNTIQIGESSTVWSYPNVTISDVTLGHSATFDNWIDGWEIGITTSTIGNVTQTVTNTGLKYNAMIMTYANGYWGMGDPNGSDSVWIRTTSQGIIPYQGGGRGSGHQYLGTNSWYFAHAYIDNVNTVRTNAYNGFQVTTTAGNGMGLGLYNNDSHNSYGIHMSYTSGYGAYGQVTGDWATYFCFDGAANRGWIFKHANTNVFSINGQGTLSIKENIPGIFFRPGHGSYDANISYQTSGNEAMVFTTKNAVTSFMFVNGEDTVANISSNRWTVLTPGLQIKNNCVAIGKLIADGSSPGYKLEVSGTSRFNGIVFGYNYGNTNCKADAAFIWDKPGSYYTGVGANGSDDTIQFGACSVDGKWVSHTQNWIFKGNVRADGYVWANGGCLYSTANSNQVTIGSLNADWCHIYNSANIPFIFNRKVFTIGAFCIYELDAQGVGKDYPSNPSKGQIFFKYV